MPFPRPASTFSQQRRAGLRHALKPSTSQQQTSASLIVPVSCPCAEPLWSIDDVAARLGVSRQTIYEWRRRGKGPRGYRVGRHLRFELADIEAWLEAVREPGS